MKILPLLLLGGGAYFLTKKDKPATTDTKKDNIGSHGYSAENSDENGKCLNTKDLPQVDDQDEDKPKVDDKDPNEGIKTDIAEYYDPYLINNGEYPSQGNKQLGTDLLWVSESCQSWGVGKTFLANVTLPEKYLFANTNNPDNLLTPAEYWDRAGKEFSPAPWYINNIPSDIPCRAFAANVIDYWKKYTNNCDISPPRRSNFKTYGEYKIILNKFASTPLGKLFDYLSFAIQEQMYSAWEKKYPNEALLEIYKSWALDAVVKYPNETAGKQTDLAYAWTFKDDPDAPKKLNPKNPKHKAYISAWTRINIEVKNYRGLIKLYGN